MKVRLKPAATRNATNEEIGFNSMKVRLKPGKDGKDKNKYCSFNSMKVRLKQQHKGSDGAQITFQFHEGPIKAINK